MPSLSLPWVLLLKQSANICGSSKYIKSILILINLTPHFFQRLPNMDVVPEPVEKWTNLNGTDLLDLLFKDPKRWALAQESYVQLTMLQEHLVRLKFIR